MAAENSDLQLQEQIKYIKSKQNRKSQFYFDFHHWVLENIRGFFQKHKKYNYKIFNSTRGCVHV